MIEKNFVINNIEKIKKNLKKKNFELNDIFIIEIDKKIKNNKTITNNLEFKHNFISNLIKILIEKKINCKIFVLENIIIKKKLNEKKNKLNFLLKKFKILLLSIPNMLDDSVKNGKNEMDNIELKVFYKKNIHHIENDIENKNHFIDFELSSKISKSGFVFLKNEIALLHRAIGNYMLDLHVFKHKYTEIYSPLIVNENSMINTGHFPKFYNDQFNIKNTNLWLIPTAEITLSNIIMNQKIKKPELPIKFVSKTSCFRKEKGNYGYKIKGLIRQHQFDKVELVQIATPEKSFLSLEEITFHAETVLKNLNLPYRILSLCSSDIGFSSSKTYDIEVWLPKRKMYMEISSCSNTKNFQSKRMNAKIICNNKYEYPHILNGSGLAIGRTLLAIIENYSLENGDIFIPNILSKYMNGKKIIKI